jgi:hypothetical protein
MVFGSILFLKHLAPKYMNIIDMFNSTVYCTESIFVNLLNGPGSDSQPGGVDSSESIPGLLKRLQTWAL